MSAEDELKESISSVTKTIIGDVIINTEKEKIIDKTKKIANENIKIKKEKNNDIKSLLNIIWVQIYCGCN